MYVQYRYQVTDVCGNGDGIDGTLTESKERERSSVCGRSIASQSPVPSGHHRNVIVCAVFWVGCGGVCFNVGFRVWNWLVHTQSLHVPTVNHTLTNIHIGEQGAQVRHCRSPRALHLPSRKRNSVVLWMWPPPQHFGFVEPPSQDTVSCLGCMETQSTTLSGAQ